MTSEELQTIVAAVLSAIRTNSRTIDALTAVTELESTDCFEVAGGKKVSYGVLSALIAATVDTGSLATDIAKATLQSVSFSVDGSTATLSVKQAGYNAVTASVPVATSSQSGIITATDKAHLDAAYTTANSAVTAAATADGKAEDAVIDTFSIASGVGGVTVTLKQHGFEAKTVSIPTATTSADGLMTSTDKAKLEQLSVTEENINPDYPTMLAVEGEDYTVLNDKSGAYNGSTLDDTPGNYCVVVEFRAKWLSFVNKKSGYGALWLYSAEPNSSDYTANRVKTVAMSASSGNVGDEADNIKYAIIDIGENIDTFRCWFTEGDLEPEYVVSKIGGSDIKVNASYRTDENLFDAEHNVPGGGASGHIFEFDVTPGLNHFVMWNDVNIVPINSSSTWREYDANGTLLVDENFYTYTNTQALLFFGGDNKRACKVLLNKLTKKLSVAVNLNGTTIEELRGKVRMFVNTDGHLARHIYPTAIEGNAFRNSDLGGKVIACFGDSITAFGNADAYGGWPFFLQKKLDNGIANYARGNATIADWSDTDYTYNSRTVGNNHNNTVSSQIRWMLDDGLVPDIVIINGGINDIAKGNGYSFDIPAAVAAYPNTTAAVFQNVAMLICYAVSVLRNVNPNVKIYLSTPAKTLTDNRAADVASFAANMRLVAEAFGLEIIDFHRYAYQPYPSTPESNPYFYDYTHPSQLGIDMLGRIVMRHLKGYAEP